MRKRELKLNWERSMRPKSVNEAHLERHRLAEEGARDLRLVKAWEDDDEPRLARYFMRGRWWTWVEVVVLHHGHLLVHGGSGYEHARGVLYWMAKAEPRYAAEKAAIGSSGKISEDWDAEVALHYVNEWESERQICSEDAEQLRDSLRWDGNQQEFMNRVYETNGLDVDNLSAGKVTSSNVFNAQACLRVLVRELESRDMCTQANGWFRRSA